MAPRFDLIGDIEAGCAAALAEFLAANTGGVDLFINSPGGDAMEGAALMAEVERHGRVTAHLQGVVASAATLPAIESFEVLVHPAAVMMIHEPAAFGGGTADQLRSTADTLEKMAYTYAEAYARHTGHPASRIAAWMKAETWLTAEEAVELRFADAIEAKAKPQAVAAFDYTTFRHPPQKLVRLALKNGWAAVPPDSE